MFSAFIRALLGLCLLSVITSCEKDDPTLSLPPKTADGLNTLGFKADNKIWVNHGQVCNLLKCEDNVVKGQLHRSADKKLSVVIEAHFTDKKNNVNQTFLMHAKNITGAGTYPLSSDREEAMNFITDWVKNTFYVNTRNSNATLLITKLDTVNHIISGEFSGVLFKHDDASSSVEIRDGRFDTKLTYIND